jgi:2-dehydro-3-deoxyphosphooctonate aldolase (KDO 8-P synthase)
MRVGEISIGRGEPLVLISGLNIIESLDATLETAEAVAGIGDRHELPVIFKASFDKANRSSQLSYRGPGLDEGLRILARVRRDTGLPLLTDIHEPGQAKIVAEVVDFLQIPAFLCRQTDLIKAAAATGRPLHIKKGQFMSPLDMQRVADKAQSFGAPGVLLTERGTTFGYNDLVVDMRGLILMREFAPVCFDATHSVQHPGAGELASQGDRRFVAPLARAAAAIGIDALFVEVHPDPDHAPCDAQCQIRPDELDRLVTEVCAIRTALE